jgi:hypothetical protein
MVICHEIVPRARGGNYGMDVAVVMASLLESPLMLGSLLRLIALRPLLSIAIFGIPLLVLIAVGLFTILALKLLVFVVLPVFALVWLYRKLTRSGDWPAR